MTLFSALYSPETLIIVFRIFNYNPCTLYLCVTHDVRNLLLWHASQIRLGTISIFIHRTFSLIPDLNHPNDKTKHAIVLKCGISNVIIWQWTKYRDNAECWYNFFVFACAICLCSRNGLFCIVCIVGDYWRMEYREGSLFPAILQTI